MVSIKLRFRAKIGRIVLMSSGFALRSLNAGGSCGLAVLQVLRGLPSVFLCALCVSVVKMDC